MHKDAETVDFSLWKAELDAPEAPILTNAIAYTSLDPTRAWPEASATGEVSVETYNARLAWRIGQAGHALDVIRDNISDDATAENWLYYKIIVAELASSEYYDGKSNDINTLSDEIMQFVMQNNFSQSAWERIANK